MALSVSVKELKAPRSRSTSSPPAPEAAHLVEVQVVQAAAHLADQAAAHLADLAEEHPGVHLALEAEHLAEDLLDLVVAHLAGLAEDPEEDHLAQEPADQEHRGDLAEKPQEGPAEPAESASLAEQGHTPQQLILDQAHLPAVAQAQEQVRTVL